MTTRHSGPFVRGAAIALLCALLGSLAACGGEAKPTDWRNRELAWKYGPTHTAPSTHLEATGTKGAGPMAKGWKVHLVDGNKIEVVPYQLAGTHAQFGKATMAVELFDKAEQKIGTVVSPVLTAEKASFVLEVEEDVAKRAWDAILWFRKG